MTSFPSRKIGAERSPGGIRRAADAMTGLATSRELRFFDESLDALQQEAVSRALGTQELLLIEAADAERREAVVAELLRQMAFREVKALVLRAEHCVQAAEVDGHSEFLNHARTQWSNLLRLAGQTTSITRQNHANPGAGAGRNGRLSWWARASNWLRERRPSVPYRDPAAVTLRNIEEAWASSCEQLTGSSMTLPSLDAVSEWHRHMCSTDTADSAEPTCQEAGDHDFNMVILLAGESLDDEMIPRLTAKGRRLVIFGALPAKSPSEVSNRDCRDAENAAAFGRLWRSLQHSPFEARYRWIEQAGQIVCRLDDYPYDSTYVERERVADRPDIELRIDAPPHGSPRLVEIVFPCGHGIEECKQFAHRELEHLAMDATGKRLHWNEVAGQITVHLSPVSSDRHCLIQIAPGVRERVCFANGKDAPANTGRWITQRLEFDRAHGWDRAKAEAWANVEARSEI